jgi:hypothetical protein
VIEECDICHRGAVVKLHRHTDEGHRLFCALHETHARPAGMTVGERRRFELGKNPEFIAKVREAKRFYDERGVGSEEPTTRDR